MTERLVPHLDRVILAADRPGFVGEVALPANVTWRQASGRVLASHLEDAPPGSWVHIVPGSGVRVKVGDSWVLIVEEAEVLAVEDHGDERKRP